jgi:hypothetical protein
MTQPAVSELGAFAAGEVPPPLEITFNNFDDDPVDLTGFINLQMNIEEELGTGAGDIGKGTVQLTDAPAGKFEYTWKRADMLLVGEYTAQGWVDNGTNYYASDLYTYTVYDGPEEPPS